VIYLDKVESDQKAIAILLNGYVPTDAPVKINQVQEKLLKKDDFNTWGDYIFAVFMKVGGVGTVHPVVEYILEVHPDFDREYVRKSATNSMSTLAKRGKLSVRKDKKSRRFIYQLIDAKP